MAVDLVMTPEEFNEALMLAFVDGYMECHKGRARGGHHKAWKRGKEKWEDGRVQRAKEYEERHQ